MNIIGKTIKSIEWNHSNDEPNTYWIELTFADNTKIYLQADDPYVDIYSYDNENDLNKGG